MKIRKELSLLANLCPASFYPELTATCPLKSKQPANSFDLVIARKLAGGLYSGERHTGKVNNVETAVGTLVYTGPEIRCVAIEAFEAATKCRKSLISVDKANVPDASCLWRRVVGEVGRDYPDAKLSYMLVDNTAMQLVYNPGQFDIIVTESTFGNVLLNEASMVTGSIGILLSAGLNKTKFGLYEPSHGSTPNITGQDRANPLAATLSAAMLFRYFFDMETEAHAIEGVVAAVLQDSYYAPDIYIEGTKKVGTREMGVLVRERI